MTRELYIRPSWLVIMLILLTVIIFAFDYSPDPLTYKDKEDNDRNVAEGQAVDLSQFPNAEENQKCFKCHGQSKYTYENTDQGRMVNAQMYSELIISPDDFYVSNHRSFKCIDCHSEEYGNFPHDGNLRMEYHYTCMDCHEGDDTYAQYHFEEINAEFQESVHSEKHSEEFTCWMCHNPHTYKITARTNENIQKTVIYDNTICLDCHSDYKRFQLLTDRERPNLIKSHQWLPNQDLHIASVRCIECHTEKLADSTLVKHKVLPKDQAVRNCRQCHSSNPELLATLYKYEALEVRSQGDFLQGFTMSDTQVIGTNRNYLLNIISLLFFAGVLAGIGIHAVLRIIKK